MDIISLSPMPGRRHRRPRRHTTEVKLEDLPKEISKKCSSQQDLDCSDLFLSPGSNQWHKGECEDAALESAHHEGSQWDVLQELTSHPYDAGTSSHSYQLSYELALDNMLTPFANQPYGPTPPTYAHHVVMEIVSTEEAYVGDLIDIVEGYIIPLESQVGILELDVADINILFGNIRDIKQFNWLVLQSLKSCHHRSKRVGECFLQKAEGFKKLYSQYCNNYPNSIQVLLKLQQTGPLSQILTTCQQKLNHMLPLGAYLLKPVQRVLQYSLLLGQLVKNVSVDEDGFAEVSCAFGKMTSVSKHINEMKEKYDANVQTRGLQNLIRGLENIDLTQAGDLVLEENLRYGGRSTVPSVKSRTDRHVYVFLFSKLMLMTKKEEDGYQYRTHLEITDIQLTERVEKETNSFQVRQASTGNYYTLQAPTHKSKEKWVKKIKTLLMESIPDLPDRAKTLIMAGFQAEFADSRRRSPKSPHRQRHFSALRAPRNSVKQQSQAKPRSRSSTTPTLSTGRLVQASLLATLQLEPFEEDSVEKSGVPAESHSEIGRPSVAGKDKESDRLWKNKSLPTTSSTSHTKVRGIPQSTPAKSEVRAGADSIPKVVVFSEEGYERPESSSNLQVHYSNGGTAGSVDSVFTESNASLFDELMGSSTDHHQSLSTSPALNEGDMQTLQLILHGSQESLIEDEIESTETPQLPPPSEFAEIPITAPVSEEPSCEDDSVPQSTPGIAMEVSSPVASSTERAVSSRKVVGRSSSVTSLSICHQGEKGRSSKCSPKVSQLKRHSSFKESPSPAVIYDIEHSRAAWLTPKKQPSLLSPRNLDMPECDSVYGTEDDRAPHIGPPQVPSQLLQPASIKPSENPSCDIPTLKVSPCEATPLLGNPDEQLSFDEVLQHYDIFATSTGKTTRSLFKKKLFQSPKPVKKEKRKKDRKRSLTITGVDRATILAAKEATDSVAFETHEPSNTTFSKVQHLAREYSRRIKDHQKSKRHVTEECATAEASERKQPEWLLHLQKQRCADSSQESDTNLTPPVEVENTRTDPSIGTLSSRDSLRMQIFPSMPQSHSAQSEHDQTETPEMERKGRLKGLVKSIVVKFSGANR